MGLFSKGRKSMGGGGGGGDWFDGNGEIIARLKSAVYKAKNQKGDEQVVLTFDILAVSQDTDVVQVGDERVYRWHSGGRYPDSDAAVFAKFILALNGTNFDENDYASFLPSLGLDPADYPLDTEKGQMLADIDIDEAVDKLRDEMVAGEGDAWAGRIAKIQLRTKEGGGFTKTFASALPEAMIDGTELSAKGVKLLERNGFSTEAPAEG